MEAKSSGYDELLLRSFDDSLTPDERTTLTTRIREDLSLRMHSDEYKKIRDMLHRSNPDSFGPFFPERVIHFIKQRSENFDYLIFFFFRKYQVLVVGLVVALVIANLLFAGEFSLQGFFGLKKEGDEDLFSIDVYKELTE